jgi:membrane protein
MSNTSEKLTMNVARAGLSLLKQAFDEWNADNAPRLAAALSYYTAFSIAPLLIVVIAVAGLALGRDAVSNRLDEQISGLIGSQGADIIQEIVANASRPQEGILATVIGVVTLVLGAIGVFIQLKGALNAVWGVAPAPGQPQQGILKTLRDHVVSFGMVLGIGFVLLVSLVISAVLASLSNFVNGLLPQTQFVSQIINFALSFVVITVLFALMFKFLPDTSISWRDVWVGAALTSLLFTIGRYLLGVYLGNSGVTSIYGAAGSFVLILLWIYYSAQIFLYGAEFTQVFAQKYGSRRATQGDPVPEVGAAEPLGDLTEQAYAREVAADFAATERIQIEPPVEQAVYAPPPKTTLGSRERVGAAVGVVASLAGFVALLIRSRQDEANR